MQRSRGAGHTGEVVALCFHRSGAARSARPQSEARPDAGDRLRPGGVGDGPARHAADPGGAGLLAAPPAESSSRNKREDAHWTHPNLQGPQHENRRRADPTRVIGGSFNFGEMARRSLGREWGVLAPAQRQEFTEVLQDLFQDSYSKLVRNFLKRETIRYGAETAAGTGARVQTVIERLAREQIPVGYRLLQSGGQWNMVDVVIDGVSIAENYRSQFTKIIRTTSYDALLNKMKLKREEIAPAQR